MRNLLIVIIGLAFVTDVFAAVSTRSKESRIETKSVAKRSPVVIAPKKLPAPAEKGSFDLSMRSGKLTLSYHARDPRFRFEPKRAFTIQLDAQDPLSITPSIITPDEWPKAATGIAAPNEIALQIKNAQRGKTYLIRGSAAFHICDKTNRCEKAKSLFSFDLKP